MLRSPTGAMLWEIWRVTRVEAAWKFAVGIAGALTVLAWTSAMSVGGDRGPRAFAAAAALAFIVAPQFLGWMFLPRLNGHRPGFPMRLLFTRPVRTAVMVGLPLVYLSVVPAAAYLASALLLKAVTGYPFPLLPVAAWIAALNLVLAALSWSSRRSAVTTALAAVIGSAWMFLAGHRVVSAPAEGAEWHDSPAFWPAIFDFPFSDYVLLALICLGVFAFAVARVARQRSGDGPALAVFWTPGAGYPERLVNLFRIPCPTSSATRAQVWFELKTRGLPALAIAIAFALAIPLLFAVSVPIDAAITQWTSNTNKGGLFFLRPMSLMLAGFSLVVMLFQGGNAFGFRYKQGRVYLSSFEMTQAYSTARLAMLKLLVRAACFLAALIIVGASAWASLPLLGDVLFIQMWNTPLGELQGGIIGFVALLTAPQAIALAAVAAIGAVIWVTAFATHGALWIRYPRTGNLVAALLLFSGLALALLALLGRFGRMSASLVDAIFTATSGIAATALVLAAAHVFWRGFSERVLTIGYLGVVLLVSVAFGAAWLTLLTAIGTQPAASVLWPSIVALMAGVLAPWALNRVRHT